MSKYQPLSRLLASLGDSKVELSFGQIEKIVGVKLPDSARQSEVWWMGRAVVPLHARAWLQAGWRIVDINLAAKTVTFRRVALSGSKTSLHSRRDPWGCMAGTVTFAPGTDLTAPMD